MTIKARLELNPIPSIHVTMLEVSGMLSSAADLVESGWCSDYGAKDAYGNKCQPMSSGATAWSYYGAICRACNNDIDAMRACLLFVGMPSAWDMDSSDTTKEKVVAVLRDFSLAAAHSAS